MTLLFGIAIFAVLLVLVPLVQAEFSLAAKKLPELFANLAGQAAPWLHANFGIVIALDIATIREFVTSNLDELKEHAPRLAAGLKAGGLFLLSLVINLVLIPVVMFVLVSTAMGIPDEFKGSGGAFLFFVAVYEFILRFVVYFGCVWVFMNLFRGEVIDRSLHYYFLTPIRREALVFGKYVAGWLSATIVFGGSTLVCFLIVYGYLDSGSASAELWLLRRQRRASSRPKVAPARWSCR